MAGEMLADREAFMVICAVRYAVGRSSYAPSIVMDEVRRLMPRIPKGDRIVLVKSIRSDLEYSGRIGGTIPYADEWTALANELEAHDGDE